MVETIIGASENQAVDQPILPVKTWDIKDIQVNVSGWKMRDVIRWQKLAQAGDAAAISREMSSVVKVWPFTAEGVPLDPRNPDSYLELDPEQWACVLEAVSGASGSRFRR